MYPPVVTKDPTAVGVEVQAACLAMFPDGDRTFVPRAFDWATAWFTGGCRDYQAVDAPYHDFEHTLQAALCMIRLLRGRHLAGASPVLTERMFQLGLLAILLHDTGYLKEREDTAGTGAKHTVTHVERGTRFAAHVLSGKGFSASEIQAVQNMIQCTSVDAALDAIPFQGEMERVLGHALGTADLLGQMAAEDYPEKLPLLYAEFEEAARQSTGQTRFVALYSGVDDLMRRTPIFWKEFVRVKLDRDFGALYRFLNHPWPDGPNQYLESVEANMTRLQRAMAPETRS